MNFTKSIFLFIFTNLVFCNLWGKSHAEDTLRDSLASYSKNFIGCKYKYASKGPKTFDCSGFTSYVFKHFGYTLSSSSSAQYTQGEKTKLGKTKKGDLIFFKGSNANSKGVGHVGIIIDFTQTGDTVRFIHASVNKGVTIDLYPGLDYYNKRFIGCRRIIGETDSSNDFIPDKEDNKPSPIDTITPSPKKDEIITPKKDTIQNTNDQKEDQTKNPTEDSSKENVSPNNNPSSNFHIVKKGDTLYRIAQSYGCSVNDIMKWNNLKNNNLKIGQQLIVGESNTPENMEKKDVQEETNKEDSSNDNAPSPNDEDNKSKDEQNSHNQDNDSEELTNSTITYIVKKGDNLYRIGKQHGCTSEELMNWNHLKNANLSIGQELIIKRK